MIGQVGRHLKRMLEDDGIPAEHVRAGLAAWRVKGLNPAVLASVVNEVMNGGGRPNRHLAAANGRHPRHGEQPTGAQYPERGGVLMGDAWYEERARMVDAALSRIFPAEYADATATDEGVRGWCDEQVAAATMTGSAGAVVAADHRANRGRQDVRGVRGDPPDLPARPGHPPG